MKISWLSHFPQGILKVIASLRSCTFSNERMFQKAGGGGGGTHKIPFLWGFYSDSDHRKAEVTEGQTHTHTHGVGLLANPAENAVIPCVFWSSKCAMLSQPSLVASIKDRFNRSGCFG